MTLVPDAHARTVLPIPDKAYAGPILYDAKNPDVHFPRIQPLRPPEGAPNVLIILIDDVGFGTASAFGGPCETPNFDAVAADLREYHVRETEPAWQALQKVLVFEDFVGCVMGTDGFEQCQGQCSGHFAVEAFGLDWLGHVSVTVAIEAPNLAAVGHAGKGRGGPASCNGGMVHTSPEAAQQERRANGRSALRILPDHRW